MSKSVDKRPKAQQSELREQIDATLYVFEVGLNSGANPYEVYHHAIESIEKLVVGETNR